MACVSVHQFRHWLNTYCVWDSVWSAGDTWWTSGSRKDWADEKVSFLLQTHRHVRQNIAGGSFKNTKGSLEKFPGCRKGGEKSNPKLWVEVMRGTGLRVQSQELEVLKSCRARRGGLKLVLGDMWEDSLASSWIFWRALLFVNRDKEILCQSFGEVARKVALIQVLEWKFTFMK